MRQQDSTKSARQMYVHKCHSDGETLAEPQKETMVCSDLYISTMTSKSHIFEKQITPYTKICEDVAKGVAEMSD